MLPGWAVIIAALAYLCGLFAVAHFGDAHGAGLLRGRRRTHIYALMLGVYCTSWTFLGSVGLASRSGFDFLTIYLGPVLVMAFGHRLVQRIIGLAKTQNSTSIADFMAARYGKSESVAAIVALIAVVGTVPYMALQLKAISSSLEVFVARDGIEAAGLSTIPLLGDLALVVALILAAFAAAFGTRQVDSTEHQDGLMIAIAMESVVKLVAFLCVGFFVTYGLFDGFGDLWQQAQLVPRAVQIIALPHDPASALTMTVLSGFAILLLPRQFHVTVVENRDPGDFAKARWLFPLYLVAINLFVVPIALAGLVLIPDAGFDRDLTVLTLPILAQSPLISLIAVIGGLSAATAMVIVESVALSIMVSNDLVMPLVLRRRGMVATRDTGSTMDMGGLVLGIRRAAILLVLVLAYLYYGAASSAALSAIGLMAFAAIAQIGPAFIGALYWKRGNARGAAAGLLAGLLAWAYTLLLPSLASPGTVLMDIVSHGPLGIGLLRPTALLGLEAPPLVNGVLFSLGINTLFFVLGSLSRRATAIEQIQANLFLSVQAEPSGPNFRLFRPTVTVDDLRATVSRYLGEERTNRAFTTFLESRNIPAEGKRDADIQVLRFSEHLLSSAIGAASSRLVLSLLLRRRNVSTKAALKLLDDASAAMQHSRDILQHALDHAGAGVTVFDRNLQLSAWNRAFQELFSLPSGFLRSGVGLDEIVRINAERGVYGPGEVNYFIRSRLESFAQTADPFRLLIQPGDRTIEIRSNQLPDGGFVTTYTQITEAVRAEKALERANETLERRVRERTEELTRVNAELGRAKKIADDANVSKTRFLAAASHDILQPLNAARLYTSALVEMQQPGEEQAIARNVDASLESVEEIITALLDISRLDSGAMKPEWSIFCLDDVFRQLQVEFAPMAREHALRLVFVPCSLSIRSDRRLLRRLLQNLISNAIKYTPAGTVLVGVRRRHGRVRLMVADSGQGIPTAKHRTIFREFQRLEQGARVARGLGLGLSIVERLSRVLNHTLTLESAPGRGSVFTLEMPVAEPVRGKMPSAEPAAKGDMALSGLVVMAIDNEPAILDGMRILLSGWGCRVVTASDLAGAQAIFRTSAEKPSVVIADYHLDEGTGIGALLALREGRGGAPMKSILLTADRSPGVQDEARQNGILVLHKPLKPAALRATLSQFLLMSAPVAAE